MHVSSRSVGHAGLVGGLALGLLLWGTAQADWKTSVLDSAANPDELSLVTGPEGEVTFLSLDRGNGLLSCGFIPDPTNPSSGFQEPIAEGPLGGLGQRVRQLPSGLVASIVEGGVLEFLTSDPAAPCSWTNQPVTGTNVYGSSDIAELDGIPVVIGSNLQTGNVDVYTPTVQGEFQQVAVISNTLGLAPPDLFRPTISAGNGQICVHAATKPPNVTYFSECSGLGIEGPFVFGQDVLTDTVSQPVAGFFSGWHIVAFHQRAKDAIVVVQIQESSVVTVTVGAAPSGPFAMGLEEADRPNAVRVVWPGQDVVVGVAEPFTDTVSSFPITYSGALAFGRIESAKVVTLTHVAVGAGSLLYSTFTPFTPAVPVPALERWGGVLAAVLLVFLALAAARRQEPS